MDLNQLKNLLRSYNLKPNATYGQNFLVDEIVLEDITDSAKVSEHDTILEIGPGIGNLTRKLLERGASVLSVEKDPKFLPILKAIKKDFPKTFRWEISDILEFDFQKALSLEFTQGSVNPKSETIYNPTTNYQLLTTNYKVVANIPYYITGKILQMFLTTKFKPKSITVLTQKEVAKNVIAKPGQLSILGISVQLFGEPSLARLVPAKSFYPAPKVDSAVLHIELFEKPQFEIDNEKKFFALLKICFAGKRKQLYNTLGNFQSMGKEKAGEMLASLGILPSIRPQELSLKQWYELYKKF